MKTMSLLLIAIIGNALGSALMFQSHLGMSAWGASASNVSLFFTITPGLAFIIVSVFFYIIAILLNRSFSLSDAILSALFLVSFSTVLDLFIEWLPSMESYSLFLRLMIDLIGLLILLFSISIHIHINIAVHPMDVYLKALHDRCNNVAVGTYIAYGSAFMVAILFGVLAGGIRDIGVGTVITVVLGGLIMDGYNRLLFQKKEETHVSN